MEQFISRYNNEERLRETSFQKSVCYATTQATQLRRTPDQIKNSTHKGMEFLGMGNRALGIAKSYQCPMPNAHFQVSR
ncbi:MULTISPECIES: hypothetical protein [unclassified Tolypothrix]|uniref:hypothetical protein n=1 Tax=unclassified Tolypothrix TaxID=2649714 RepID=UPI0005EAB90A|nr:MULTISPECIES: hypothetical protein [unclassified Tolypothrix]BAY93248.1 hypothetical protein NIES3275_52870 [Microchaete diplosiphon NIES-3275]EKF00166.1 hypothetical protein FDUTEX481_09201 [Tolypothrix sp. PCC 7601]MBE9083168.1 hypothetical protein [Tolypothrix sp. LEGE 11397]UYD27117.1 hypothetical protein HGR01_03135 [Tolypothrix sp. PCC 7712]UYD37025.1 hypothetical protein HG267_15625 [Tolypothrix sp. PCC 7601]